MFCILLGHAMLICPFATTIQSLIIDQTVTFFLATLTHPVTNVEILSSLVCQNANGTKCNSKCQTFCLIQLKLEAKVKSEIHEIHLR